MWLCILVQLRVVMGLVYQCMVFSVRFFGPTCLLYHRLAAEIELHMQYARHDKIRACFHLHFCRSALHFTMYNAEPCEISIKIADSIQGPIRALFLMSG